MKTPLIVHHSGCPDGFGAAWLLGSQFAEHDKFAASYGAPPPIEQCVGRFVFIVDFAYPAGDLNDIAEVAESVLVLDHHQTAHEWLKGSCLVETTIADAVGMETEHQHQARYVYDVNRSGAGLVAAYVWGRWGVAPPDWFPHLQDRDLWKFELPGTNEMLSAITSRPYTDKAWDEMADRPYAALLAEGTGIERYRQQLIDFALSTAYEADIFGIRVWVAACPFTIGSDVGGKLAERRPEAFGAYYVDYGNRRRYGLRSLDGGIDVAKLAELRGGGGHQHASGFEVPVGEFVVLAGETEF